eukprot:TRINITY_DN20557_c0_g1_i1.p1 TRINITY_DN20557_c0_g1~~TRINITY_DN20557_c0_g1_i1.p1  ORF type:complete len:1053 (-),score=214.33 TRINITY_DN20557_c0_g1_i1:75-3233(-)
MALHLAQKIAVLALCVPQEGVAAKLRLRTQRSTGVRTYNHTEIPGLGEGLLCTDTHANWVDLEGDSCQDYLANELCDRSKGTDSAHKSVTNWVGQNLGDALTSNTVCCACGGGTLSAAPARSKCNGSCAELQDAAVQQAASQVHEQYQQQAQATGQAVSTAGASALAFAAVEMNAKVANVTALIQNSSREQTDQALQSEELRFGQLTFGSDAISQLAKSNFASLGGNAAAFQLSTQISMADDERLKTIAEETDTKFKEARKAWEETRDLALEALMASNQAGKSASDNLNSALANLSAGMRGIEEVAGNAAAAEQAAREVQEKTRVVAEVTQQVQELDANVTRQLHSLQQEFNQPVVLPSAIMGLSSAMAEESDANAQVAKIERRLQNAIAASPAAAQMPIITPPAIGAETTSDQASANAGPSAVTMPTGGQQPGAPVPRISTAPAVGEEPSATQAGADPGPSAVTSPTAGQQPSQPAGSTVTNSSAGATIASTPAIPASAADTLPASSPPTTGEQTATQATTTLQPSAPRAKLIIEGDYATVVTNKASFLEECSVTMAPATCVDVYAGSIVVVVAATEQETLDTSVAKVAAQGMVLPSIGSFSVTVSPCTGPAPSAAISPTVATIGEASAAAPGAAPAAELGAAPAAAPVAAPAAAPIAVFAAAPSAAPAAVLPAAPAAANAEPSVVSSSAPAIGAESSVTQASANAGPSAVVSPAAPKIGAQPSASQASAKARPSSVVSPAAPAISTEPIASQGGANTESSAVVSRTAPAIGSKPTSSQAAANAGPFAATIAGPNLQPTVNSPEIAALEEQLAAALSRRDAAASRVEAIESLGAGSAAPINISGTEEAMNRRQELEQELETLQSAENNSAAVAVQQELVSEDPSVAAARAQVASLQSQVNSAQHAPQPTLAPCSNITVHCWQQELANTGKAKADAMVQSVQADLTRARSEQALKAQYAGRALTAVQAQSLQTSLDNARRTAYNEQIRALQSQLSAAHRAQELHIMIANAECDAAPGETTDTGLTPDALVDRNAALVRQLDADLTTLEQKAR